MIWSKAASDRVREFVEAFGPWFVFSRSLLPLGFRGVCASSWSSRVESYTEMALETVTSTDGPTCEGWARVIGLWRGENSSKSSSVIMTWPRACVFKTGAYAWETPCWNSNYTRLVGFSCAIFFWSCLTCSKYCCFFSRFFLAWSPYDRAST